jgi:hypothetical protein
MLTTRDIRIRYSASRAFLYRNIRLLIDEGAHGVNDASLGSANLIFLTLKALQLKHMLEENKRGAARNPTDPIPSAPALPCEESGKEAG